MSALANYLKNIAIAVVTTTQAMGVAFKYMVRPAVTLQYPDERASIPQRSRGFLDVDLSICTACKVCEVSCPIDCITIDVEKDPGDKKKKYMSRFDIDLGHCMFCSLCVDPCPTGAIYMTSEYEMAWDSRGAGVAHFIKEGERVEAAKE